MGDFVNQSVPVLPISGWMGDNLINKSTKMDWWKGVDIKVDKETLHIDTLKEALEKMVRTPDRPTDKPMRTPSTACTGKVFTVEMHHKTVDAAKPGDNVGLNIKGLNKDNMPRVGDVMVLKTDSSVNRVENFTAQVQILNHPGELKCGYTPIAFVRTARSAVKMVKINWKIGKETGGQKLEDAPMLKANEMAEIVMEPQQPF